MKRRLTVENQRTYRSWWGMMARCYRTDDRDYRYYGARGIRVCDRWHVFEKFLEDVGTRPAGMSIDRVDNDGDYDPGNWRWATPTQQARNSRRVKLTPELAAAIRVVAAAGMKHDLLASALGIHRVSVDAIIRGASWSPEDE